LREGSQRRAGVERGAAAPRNVRAGARGGQREAAPAPLRNDNPGRTRNLPRICIDNIEPAPHRTGLKRLVGDSLEVSSDILCDGAPVLDACIRYKVPGEPRWRYAPLRPAAEPERWCGVVRLQSGGLHQVSIEAWVDPFATWQRDMAARVEDDPRALLDDGRALLERAAASTAGLDREFLAERARHFEASGDPQRTRQLALDPQLGKRMRVHGERQELVRSEPPLRVTVDRRRAGFAAWCAWSPEAPPHKVYVALESELEVIAAAGFDVLCLPRGATRSTGSGRPDARLATFAARARLLGLEVALDLGGCETSPPAGGLQEADWARWLDSMRAWIERGISTFRVVAPHRWPFPFWSQLLARLKREHPEAVILAGRSPEKHARALARLGFSQTDPGVDWSAEGPLLRRRLERVLGAGSVDNMRPHLLLDDLQTTPGSCDVAAARVQLLLAATLSPLYTLQVGEGGLRDAADALSEEIRRVNRMRRENRALQLFTNVRFLRSGNERILCFLKSTPHHRNELLIAINLDARQVQEGTVEVPLDALGFGPEQEYGVEDLWSGHRFTWHGERNFVRLDPQQQPGHVLRVVRERELGVCL
jgi:starch synthase (maltosyl-transferring)